MRNSWRTELVKLRRINYSNVYLLVTDDYKRVRELIHLIGSVDMGFRTPRKEEVEGKPVKLSFEKTKPIILEIDVNKNTITQWHYEKNRGYVEGQKVRRTLRELLQMGCSTPVAYIIHFIFREQEASMIANMLMGYSQDSQFYLYRSTIFVFTHSTSLFPKPLLHYVGVIEINPSDEERRRIIEAHMRRYGMRFRSEILSYFKGLNLHETETAILDHLGYGTSIAEATLKLKAKKLRLLGANLVNPKMGLERIGGYNEIKGFISENFIGILNNLELAREHGIGLPKGILFVGPPGTGKTVWCRALAYEAKYPMIEVRGSSIFGSRVGETERNIEMLIRIANDIKPSLLLFDEVEQVALARDRVSATDSGVSIRVTAMLISAMSSEDRGFITLATANYPEMLDRAFLRRGRFDYIIPVLYPDYEARIEIVKVHTSIVRKIPLDDDVEFEEIARKTPWASGADLEGIVEDAYRIALSRYNGRGEFKVSMADFKKALERTKIPVNERKEFITRLMEVLSRCPDAPVVRDLYERQLERLNEELRLEAPRELLDY